MTRYRTIVADPPWEYPGGFGGFNAAGKGPLVRRSLPYRAMSAEQIAVLPVADLADERGANLFLWTTNRYLPTALAMLAGWDASYCQLLVWHKTGANPNTGGIAPTSCEYLIYATLNDGAGLLGKLPDSLLTTKRLANRHSAKPEAWLDHIEDVSPPSRLEMFARRNRLGWDTWGDEALGHVEMSA